MSDRSLTRLPRTQFSGLDFNNIIEDVRQLVEENPDFNENWDDFLESNAGRMIAELFAYIGDNLATRIDWYTDEAYIGTSTQRKSVMRILRLIGYNFRLPIPSNVTVTATFSQPVGEFYLTPQYSPSQGTITPFSVTAPDRNGETRSFELINYDESSEQYDYKSGVSIDTGDANSSELLHRLPFYEGKTVVQTFTVQTNNNPVFTLAQAPVIEGSVKVYGIEQINNAITETEHESVRSFLSPAAQQATDTFGNQSPLAYVQKVNEENTVTIEYGPTTLLPDSNRRPQVGDQIRVFYRVGGGEDGNITRRAINSSRRRMVNGTNVNIQFVNESAGTNGQDGETAEEAAINAPVLVRTAENTVTESDYDTTLSSENSVLKSKSYGNNNIPSNLYNLYGMYIRPLEVWNYVLKNKPNWEDIQPSRYDDFRWLTTRLENRFNQKHAFRDGEFNFDASIPEFSINTTNRDIAYNSNGDSKTFRNYTILTTPQDFKDAVLDGSVLNQDFIARMTNKEISDSYFDSTAKNNIFSSLISTNEGTFQGSNGTTMLEKKINARFLSSSNIAGNVDMSVNNLVSISIDNRTIIDDIDLSGGTASDTTPEEIVNAINTTFQNNASYNNGAQGSTKGYQEFGLSVDASTTISFSSRTMHVRVNTVEYAFETGGNITYSELATKLEEAFSFKIYGDFTNTESTIENIDTGEKIHELRNGFRIESASLQSNSYIGSVNPIDNTAEIVDSGGSSIGATGDASQEEITVYPFSVTIEGSSPSQDIRITNLQEQPYGPVWVENGTNSDAENNLLTNTTFSNAGFSSMDAPTASEGTSGSHELGIKGVIDATSGFQEFSESTPPTIPTDGNYGFKLTVDGSVIDGNPSGGSSSDDIVITLTTNDSLADIVSKLTSEVVNNLGASVGITLNGTTGRIRITSDATGSSSTIVIDPPSSTDSLLDVLGGVEPAQDGEDAGDSGLSANTTYTFRLNDYVYEITTGSGTITFNDLIALFTNALSPHSYSVSKIGSEWDEEIQISSVTTGWVYLEMEDASTDIFNNIGDIVRLDNDAKKQNEEWDGFENLVGGGDYSTVAYRIVQSNPDGQDPEFIMLRSPSFGEFSSQILFSEPQNNSIQTEVFGINDNVINYGMQRATIITNLAFNEAIGNIVTGNIIIENGSSKLDNKDKPVYLHHLSTDNQTIALGTYNNMNFSEDDPSWREIAKRIYNTHYDQTTKEIDTALSNFQLRFTEQEVEAMSLYAISNDWNLTESSPAEVVGVQNPQDNVGTSNYLINVDIDERGTLEIDVTGDTGNSTSYSINNLLDNINIAIQNNSAYMNNDTYSSFQFAILNDANDRIILRSPTDTNTSKIEFSPPSNNDATNEVFGLSESDYPHVYEASGDYFIEYDTRTLTGDFTQSSNVVQNISSSDLEKIEEGMRILTISNISPENRVESIDEDNNSITLKTEASNNSLGQEFQVSPDYMIMTKLNNETTSSSIPDLEMNIHFISDKRYVEGAFDGEIVNNVQRPGYPLGTLDEDIYRDFLEDKKVTPIENVFKETKFSTFDIQATIHYQRIFAETDVRARVEQSLRDTFGIENRNYGQNVELSHVINTIQSNEGVDFVRLSYLGKDAQDFSTAVDDQIEANFDEIIVLSENRFFSGSIVHGLLLIYTISSGG